MSDNKIDRNEYDMLYPSEKEFKTWVQNQVDEIAQLLAETLYLLSLK